MIIKKYLFATLKKRKDCKGGAIENRNSGQPGRAQIGSL